MVFSTYVEVIPKLVGLMDRCKRILHVCGGDPDPFEDKMTPEEYSPRMWRQLFMANINIQKNCIHKV